MQQQQQLNQAVQSSTANEIDQINLQINELLSKRQTLEQKWETLEEKDIQLQLISKCAHGWQQSSFDGNTCI